MDQYDVFMSTNSTEGSSHCLIFINGAQPGSAVVLDRESNGLTIGRGETRDIPLDDPVASRLHARLWFDGQHWQIEDCGSSNGTKVNSEWVERAILEAGGPDSHRRFAAGVSKTIRTRYRHLHFVPRCLLGQRPRSKSRPSIASLTCRHQMKSFTNGLLICCHWCIGYQRC